MSQSSSVNARAREILKSWILGRLAAAEAPARVAVKTGERVLGTYAPEPGEEPEAFASRMLAELEEDAEMQGEKLVYVLGLFVYAGTDPDGTSVWRETATKSLRVLPESAPGYDALDAGGSLLAQAYRDKEATQRFALQAMSEALAQSQHAQTLAYTREQQFRDREWEDRALIRATLERRLELEASRETAAAEREVMLEAISLIGGLAPGALSALMRVKRGGPSGPPPPEHVLLEEFLRSVRPEQFSALAGCLSDAQRIPLMQIVQGEILPELVPGAVRRLLAQITEEQSAAIERVLDEEQKKKFFALLEMKRHALDLRIRVGELVKAPEAPQIPAPPAPPQGPSGPSEPSS